mmetsp:Transcript_26331/g.47750  ORF Transcript_26331/g.47750 Transcript_26331/m.47750 type:complete len:201 (+) Transcript_26331:1048-1650(+)
MVMLCIPGDCFCGSLRKCHSHIAVLVESHCVSISKLEGSCALTIMLITNSILSNTFNISLRVELAFHGMVLCTVWVTLELAIHPVVVARCCCHRSYGDVLNVDQDSITYFGICDLNGNGDFMTALQVRGDHRSPASGSSVGNDVTTILDRPQEGLSGIQEAISELVHVDSLSSSGRISNVSKGKESGKDKNQLALVLHAV